MKGRVLILGQAPGGGTAAALMVDGRLEDFLRDPAGPAPRVGEIHSARVVRVGQKGTAGAFVELSGGGNGFLREARGVRGGERFLVQIASLPEPGKAVPVTRRVLYKTRTLIHTPDAPGVNVSRQIEDKDERHRLQRAVEDAVAPYLGDADLDPALEESDDPALRRRAIGARIGRMAATGGFILRSAAEGAPEGVIAEAVGHLAERRLAAEARLADGATGPVERAPAMVEALREWTWPLPDRLVLDRRGHATLAEAPPLPDLPPVLIEEAERHDGDPFVDLGVADSLDDLASRRVDLPGGGSMAVEATAALVAVDVNTGGDFAPDAGARANVEAARALPRQLRLRGLGGQVVVDFAPMPKKDRKRIEDVLKAALRRDGIETVVHGFTTMGLCELQRKRERPPVGPWDDTAG